MTREEFQNLDGMNTSNKKFYVEIWKYKMIVYALSEEEACQKMILKLIDKLSNFNVSMIMTVSEAGFNNDLKKYGTAEQLDTQQVLCTEAIIYKIMDKKQDSKLESILYQLMCTLDEMKTNRGRGFETV